VSKVVVPLDGRVRVQSDVAEQLHPDDGVDEEEHQHQHHDVGKSLKKGKIRFRSFNIFTGSTNLHFCTNVNFATGISADFSVLKKINLHSFEVAENQKEHSLRNREISATKI
jgi:hypothetical protein